MARGGVDAVVAQERIETVLVPADFQHGCGWQEQVLAQLLTHARQAIRIRINRRNNEIQAFCFDNPSQCLGPFRVVHGRNEIVSVRVGFLQSELVVVTADDEDRLGPPSQAAGQIVARSVTSVRKEQSRSQLTSPASHRDMSPIEKTLWIIRRKIDIQFPLGLLRLGLRRDRTGGVMTLLLSSMHPRGYGRLPLMSHVLAKPSSDSPRILL
ncbi:hypothetical protein AXW67_39580 [Bradyrhizobium neotropicale]|uniref:Uncharacterized protein n=1 Tax=Bradyrhizobium neotropicale TaxID=1497615 RepID=A0A176ZH45_9BRAD|nr:hypothetical protein AXW67_39580 [Bradyrhizobium neotropicale]